MVKKAGKHAIKEATRAGKDTILQGIDFLEQKATNKVGHPELIQSFANSARGKTHAGADKFVKGATHTLDTSIDNLVARHLPKPAVKQTKQRKRKAEARRRHHKHSKKRRTNNQKTLAELIDQV